MNEKKQVIFEILGDWDAAKPFHVEAITVGFNRFVVDDADRASKVRELGKVEIISSDPAAAPDSLLGDGDQAGTGDARWVTVTVSSREDEGRATRLASEGIDTVIVDATDWKVIPLENLISIFQKTSSKLVARARGVEEAHVFLETLERGVDGVLVTIDAATTPVEAVDFSRWRALVASTGRVELVDGTICQIQEVGSGDRVCVDTISMLGRGEGMLVGNHARGFFLIHGEIADTEFVNARPFRVNAGAVHSYVLQPGNKTGYLSELAAGSTVMIVDNEGRTRETKVGRAKIETRPMLLVEATHHGETISAIIQNAETICLVTPAGEQVSVSKLKVGDVVRLHVSGSKGRHFGKDIEERMIEK